MKKIMEAINEWFENMSKEWDETPDLAQKIILAERINMTI